MAQKDKLSGSSIDGTKEKLISGTDVEENVDQKLEKNCKEGQITLTDHLEVNETNIKELDTNNVFHILPIEKLLMTTLTSSKTRSKFFGSYEKIHLQVQSKRKLCLDHA